MTFENEIRPRMLIVEDEELIREILEAMAIKMGFDAHAVESNREAKGLVQRFPGQFKMAVFDNDVTDGSTADGTIQLFVESNPRALMLMISARDPKSQVDAATAAGAEKNPRVLQKYFDATKFSSMIASMKSELQTMENIKKLASLS